MGRGQLRVPSFVLTLPSGPAASECNPLAGRPAGHWAEFDEQLPVQPERRHNRDIPDKDTMRVPGAFQLHPDEGETLLGSPPPPRPTDRKYGPSQRNKAGRVPRRAGNMLEKTTGHMQSAWFSRSIASSKFSFTGLLKLFVRRKLLARA